ncbi:MAG: aspartate/glutamate racemase family protein [Beijerinckiaceae bacterium]|nr:aspartate/glutamate racemase family protein [Beijerinckiaceae bacterium]MCZ8301386.1 aspartate/glutamate racemase family protein [Beijerinckiaceae bacterium]
MKRVLVINPNTRADMTAMVVDAARLALPGVGIRPATGRFGGLYIASRAAFAIAGHAAIEAFAEHADGCDAVLLACFGDPGLDALREISSVPVIGLVEAAALEAAAGGKRYAIVTGGLRWGPMLEEMVRLRRLDATLAGIHTIPPTGGAIASDPDAFRDVLAEACRHCVSAFGAERVILGGAGLIGLAARVQPFVDVPVICSVEAGFRAVAAALVAPPAAVPPPQPDGVASVGLTPALARFL